MRQKRRCFKELVSLSFKYVFIMLSSRFPSRSLDMNPAQMYDARLPALRPQTSFPVATSGAQLDRALVRPGQACLSRPVL